MYFKRIKMLPFLLLFAYMRFVLFVRVKSFRKKKIKKKFKIVLMTSFTLLLSKKLFLLPLKKNLPAIFADSKQSKTPFGETL